MPASSSRLSSSSIALFAALGGLGGCDAVNDALTPTDSEEARTAVESMALTRIEASLVMALAEPTPLGESPERMAVNLEEALPTIFMPADCVQAETAGANITMRMEGCIGPRGLGISGVVNVLFTAEAAESVTINVTAADLEIGGATMGINATSTYEARPDIGHRLAVNTQGGGTAPGGTIVGRLGAYVATWDGDCYGIDGEWSSSLDDQIFITTVNDYYVCEGFCPASGNIVYGATDGGVADGDISGTALTITYLGTDNAAWVATDGSFGQQALQCTADPQERQAP